MSAITTKKNVNQCGIITTMEFSIKVKPSNNLLYYGTNIDTSLKIVCIARTMSELFTVYFEK